MPFLDPTFDAARAQTSSWLHHPLAPSGPLTGCLLVMTAAIVLCWILQTLTRNYSWVDRLWSLMPPLYLWIFAGSARSSPRLVLMAALATLWGVRLTYNFARKGGYDPREEDYRWAWVRRFLEQHDPLHPLGREVFSLFFIALYQHVLIASFVVPAAFAVSEVGSGALTLADIALAVVFVAFCLVETVADQQQWRFHQEKRRVPEPERQARGGDLARGFLSQGLFRWSRHPNFLSEMAMWWVIGLFPVMAGVVGGVSWTLVGPFLLTLLFQGSTQLTETISSGKYPAYAQYRKVTSRLLFWPPRGSMP